MDLGQSYPVQLSVSITSLTRSFLSSNLNFHQKLLGHLPVYLINDTQKASDFVDVLSSLLFLCDETNMIEVVEDSRLLRVQFLKTNQHLF